LPTECLGIFDWAYREAAMGFPQYIPWVSDSWESPHTLFLGSSRLADELPGEPVGAQSTGPVSSFLDRIPGRGEAGVESHDSTPAFQKTQLREPRQTLMRPIWVRVTVSAIWPVNRPIWYARRLVHRICLRSLASFGRIIENEPGAPAASGTQSFTTGTAWGVAPRRFLA